MGKVKYFISGTCYKKGTSEVVRRFSGITTQTYNAQEPDPDSALDAVKKQEFEICAAEKLGEVYVHIDQMNTL